MCVNNEMQLMISQKLLQDFTDMGFKPRVESLYFFQDDYGLSLGDNEGSSSEESSEEELGEDIGSDHGSEL